MVSYLLLLACITLAFYDDNLCAVSILLAHNPILNLFPEFFAFRDAKRAHDGIVTAKADD